uniref:C-type lectin domain-containing protein n=1 Tax=Calidris pygmaea TaxID=425635 RepID=A0A8C3KGJ0_9CHAR
MCQGRSKSTGWFLLHMKGNIDYWIGLRRRGERLQWVDGSMVGEEPCLFLNDRDLLSARCSQPWPYLCSKPQELMETA